MYNFKCITWKCKMIKYLHFFLKQWHNIWTFTQVWPDRNVFLMTHHSSTCLINCRASQSRSQNVASMMPSWPRWDKEKPSTQTHDLNTCGPNCHLHPFEWRKLFVYSQWDWPDVFWCCTSALLFIIGPICVFIITGEKLIGWRMLVKNISPTLVK